MGLLDELLGVVVRRSGRNRRSADPSGAGSSSDVIIYDPDQKGISDVLRA
jgi:hypothetical protein